MTHLQREENIIAKKKFDNVVAEEMREYTVEKCKAFKTGWIEFAQALYAIKRDRQYEYWGFESFDDYLESELNVKASEVKKLIKLYKFLEDWEPELVSPEHIEKTDGAKLLDANSLGLLQQVKNNKALDATDYADFKDKIVEKKQGFAAVKQDLTHLIKERKEVDSDVARDERQRKVSKKFLEAWHAFKVEAGILKLIPGNLLKRVEELFNDISQEIS